MFGFTLQVVTTLSNKHLLKSKTTLAELEDEVINNICPLVHCDWILPIAKVAMTSLSLQSFGSSIERPSLA